SLAAAHLRASFATSSSFTDACRAPKLTHRCSPNSTSSAGLAIAAMSTSSTTALLVIRKPSRRSCQSSQTGSKQKAIRFKFTAQCSAKSAGEARVLFLVNPRHFGGVFNGNGNPEPGNVIAIRKKANPRRNIAHGIHTIYAAGLFVTAGFIVGFDSETQS